MIYVINWFVNILTLGLVSIATITTTTYHVDEPIPELNNLSLTQVFEDGASTIDDLSVISGRATIIEQSDNYFKWQVDSNISGYMLPLDITLSTNDNLYLRYDIKLSENVPITHRFQFTTTNQWSQNFTANLLQSYSTIKTSPINSVGITLGNSSSTIGSQHELFNLYTINLTALGINLTKEQMDYWFSIYQQAVANNGVYIESNAHLNNNIHLVDVSVMVISFGLWTWLYKFLKGVVL